VPEHPAAGDSGVFDLLATTAATSATGEPLVVASCPSHPLTEGMVAVISAKSRASCSTRSYTARTSGPGLGSSTLIAHATGRAEPDRRAACSSR